MALTVTLDMPKAERISRNLHMVTGIMTFSGTYPTNGELLTDVSKWFITLLRMTFDQKSGYLFEFVKGATNATCKVKVLHPRSAQAVAASGANQPTVTTGAVTASAVDATTPTVTVPAGFRSAVDAAVGTEFPTGALAITGVSFIAVGLS